MIYYVSNNGNDRADGTAEAPFKTISRAASVAVPGDTVRVHGGVYREWVSPENGGTSERNRIIYEAVEGERPIIKGSEIVTGWEHVSGTVWRTSIPNSLFGDFNPFATVITGDWYRFPRDLHTDTDNLAILKKVKPMIMPLRHPYGYDAHLGDLYLNGKSMFEASCTEDLYTAEKIMTGYYAYTNPDTSPMPDPVQSIYRYLAEVGEETTVIYGNFHEYDPNKELTEISVRPACFYPRKTGRNYITLRGFEIAQAASPFIAPTADQRAMVGPNWSHHWIIEDNCLHDSKCVAISLGKEASTGDNDATRFKKKSGHYHQLEATYRAFAVGWSREQIGSHVVRRNVIRDCGQAGIVGNLGCIFCTIEDNHIYNIATKREFWGHEIAGIKFHAPIDTVIRHNHIHQCTLGIWLDWQSQGTRVTANLLHDNASDLKIEVTHGPCTVDHNVMLSDFVLDCQAQGTAFVHNLMRGYVAHNPVADRETPYHFPHSTVPLGYVCIYGGDDRYLNNILIGVENVPEQGLLFTSSLDSFSTPEEFNSRVYDFPFNGRDYYRAPRPVYVENNAYADGATPFRAEKGAVMADGLRVALEEKDGIYTVILNVPETLAEARCTPVTTERLGTTLIVDQRYEDKDGNDLDFSKDITGEEHGEHVFPGPFAKLSVGEQRIAVWKHT